MIKDKFIEIECYFFVFFFKCINFNWPATNIASFIVYIKKIMRVFLQILKYKIFNNSIAWQLYVYIWIHFVQLQFLLVFKCLLYTPMYVCSLLTFNFYQTSAMNIQKDEKNRIILIISDTFAHLYSVLMSWKHGVP